MVLITLKNIKLHRKSYSTTLCCDGWVIMLNINQTWTISTQGAVTSTYSGKTISIFDEFKCLERSAVWFLVDKCNWSGLTEVWKQCYPNYFIRRNWLTFRNCLKYLRHSSVSSEEFSSCLRLSGFSVWDLALSPTHLWPSVALEAPTRDHLWQSSANQLPVSRVRPCCFSILLLVFL